VAPEHQERPGARCVPGATCAERSIGCNPNERRRHFARCGRGLVGKDALKDISVNDIKSKASEATERASGFFATFRQNYQQELEAMKQAEKSSGKRS